jgi:hypothetical protein
VVSVYVGFLSGVGRVGFGCRCGWIGLWFVDGGAFCSGYVWLGEPRLPPCHILFMVL